MKKIINNYDVSGYKYFAFDGCHKIYLLDKDTKKEAMNTGYHIYPIKDIISCFVNSCPLRFIQVWSNFNGVIEQGETEICFEGFDFDVDDKGYFDVDEYDTLNKYIKFIIPEYDFIEEDE